MVFRDRLPLAVRYAGWLAGPAVHRGLIGPAEGPRVWQRHLLNCAVLAELIPPRCWVLDLGSGPGLPGIPLALARPDLRITLLEPQLRRVRFLSDCLSDLALPAVKPLRARVEQLSAPLDCDMLVTRAVAPLTRLVPLVAPLLADGRALLAIVSRAAATGTTIDELRRSGCRPALFECGTGLVDPPTSVVRIGPVARSSDRSAGG